MLSRIRRFFSSEPRPAPAAPAALDEKALLAPTHAALSEGRIDEGFERLETLLRQHPHLAQAHALLGEIHHRRGDLEEARDSYILSLHHAPNAWRVEYALGLLEVQRGRLDLAVPSFERAIEHGGDTAAVNNSLGAAHAEAGAYARSVGYFRRAIELEPTFVEPHTNLGYLLFRELEAYDEGAALVAKAVELDPGHTLARLNRATVLQQQGDVEGALAAYEGVLERDPALAEARLNRGLIRLARSDFERGWIDYEARLAIQQYAMDVGAAPAWDGSDLRGKSITIYGEQGLGDEIMFASCIPDVLRAAAACTIVCSPRLVTLFSRSFGVATVVATGVDPASLPRTDWSVRSGSLPRFLRPRRDEFPAHRGYLQADSTRVTHWRSRLAALPHRLKIGISWRGGAASTRRSSRSIPLDAWRPLLQSVDADFVSLQYTDCADEIAATERMLGVSVHHWHEAIENYDETAALVTALDLVISVQTAVVHLAGALGVAVWALIPEVPEWRYGVAGASMPWYPTVKLVRKSRDEAWDDVLQKVAAGVRNCAIGGHPQ